MLPIDDSGSSVPARLGSARRTVRGMLTRRDLLGCCTVLTAERAQAQQGRIARVGFLSAGSDEKTPLVGAFRNGMADLGYVEGTNVALEFRLAGGDAARFPGFASELVAMRVDVLVVDGGSAVPAAMAATKSIPIVMATAGDPVALGYARSLA